jgi:NAD(P)-dependent dehydrogenase (short-subunit alcohol dehydrogenase family)
MQVDFSSKVVFVTGSARRVGRAIMLGFAQAGANVVIHHHTSDADADTAAAQARASGVEALIVKGDLSNPDDVAQIFDTIQHHYGRLDVMVNSAANYMRNALLDIDFAEWQQVIGVNLTGPFLCTQHAARMMIKSQVGGSIVNIGDNGGVKAWKTRPHHSISKAGVIMLTKVSAVSLGEYNIRVNCVIPGPVLQGAGDSTELWHTLAKKLPLRRTGHPANVAEACIFLAANDFITGAVLNVDGGESLM